MIVTDPPYDIDYHKKSAHLEKLGKARQKQIDRDNDYIIWKSVNAINKKNIIWKQSSWFCKRGYHNNENIYLTNFGDKLNVYKYIRKDLVKEVVNCGYICDSIFSIYNLKNK